MTDEEYAKTVDWRHDKDKLREKVASLQARVRKLEDAIKTHRDNQKDPWWIPHKEDAELYAVLED